MRKPGNPDSLEQTGNLGERGDTARGLPQTLPPVTLQGIIPQGLQDRSSHGPPFPVFLPTDTAPSPVPRPHHC